MMTAPIFEEIGGFPVVSYSRARFVCGGICGLHRYLGLAIQITVQACSDSDVGVRAQRERRR